MLKRIGKLTFIISLMVTFVISINAQEQVTIEVLFNENEVSDEEIAAFEELNPHIDVIRSAQVIDRNSLEELELARASGTLPDILRVGGSTLTGLANQGVLLDITDFVIQSERIDPETLTTPIHFYIIDDRYYGFPKDWSPDFTLFVNVTMFEEAGLPVPSAEQPFTYAELAEIAENLTIQNENGEIIQYGLTLGSPLPYIDTALTKQGEHLFDESFTMIQLTENQTAREIAQYFYELQLAGYMESVLRPGTGWLGIYERGVAIMSNGYWYNAALGEDHPAAEDHLMMLPPPLWHSDEERTGYFGVPTGFTISADTEHPEEAYAFLEYLAFGQPAINRAMSGWGLPLDKSLEEYLPTETEFQQQVLDTALNETNYPAVFRIPYPYTTLSTRFSESWDRNLQLAYAGEIDFDEFLIRVEDEVNLALLDEILQGN